MWLALDPLNVGHVVGPFTINIESHAITVPDIMRGQTLSFYVLLEPAVQFYQH